ncbi:hypothetical protein E0F15_01450 [Frankia sp. B2]|uniref:hypothetical protein n=1 Tax=unclassified Frankia TaxID=2632575 RepID=UPI000461C2A5|nr:MULTISPECIES: hypothetical protein [unclassified Frankia]KDA41072.1 hypothetical protein BMG523Draft_04118 [Frankia sp. BMG5.23]TFE35540.1 hypothetical protein E0F15_01450 [Frankia sp. B2]
MSGHQLADPTLTPIVPQGPWLTLSARLTAEVPALADRNDLVVTCAPGAGHGSPACFLFNQATVEIDGALLGSLDPATLDPSRLADRYRYAPMWGALIHEAAHARHSRWTPPPGTPPAVIDAAMLLEESRIEARQLTRRPDDRDWLRACVTTIVTAQLTPTSPPPPATPPAPATATATSPPSAPVTTVPVAPPVAMTVAEAGHTSGLLLARVDAGVLTHTETDPLHATAVTVLGPDRLAELRSVWLEAQKTSDYDATAMIRLGERWCAILGIDPTQPPQPHPSAATGAGASQTNSSSGPSAPGSTPSPLGSAIGEVLDAVTASTATSMANAAKTAARAEETAARRSAAKAAKDVFSNPNGTRHPQSQRTKIARRRDPTPAEQAAARRLARALRAAGHRERAATTVTSPTPPGRLRMRGALAADAQRAAGAIPTAQPFTRTVRRATPTPPLRIAIATDVSGTMRYFADHVASAAWIFAAAARHIPDTTAATVIFGDAVRPLTFPGQTPQQVTEFYSDDRYEDVCAAVDALEGTCQLTLPGAARLLVVVSDGRFKGSQGPDGQRRLDRLRAHGCAVLWITPDSTLATPLTASHTITLTDPAHTTDHIARAAVRALTATP